MTTLVETKPPPGQRHWLEGRLVAHVAGDTAGNPRLDIEIKTIPAAQDAEAEVTLVIPGEISPIQPTGAIGENGHYLISFFP